MRPETLKHHRLPINKATSDIEIVHTVQLKLTNSDTFLGVDMNVINATYIKLPEAHNVPVQSSNYKQHWKCLLLEKIPGIDFIKHGTKPEAHEYEVSDVEEEMEILSRASKIIRREVGYLKEWRYVGSFEDYETPKKLLQLVKWITYGLHVKREEEAEKLCQEI